MKNGIPENFCSLPFENLQLDTSGAFRPCCKALKSISKRDGVLFRLPEDSLDQVWNSEFLESLRQDFRENKRPELCQLCWEEEDAGITSLRQHRTPSEKKLNEYLDDASPSAPITLDLKPSNLCNLKCRICNPENSTSWFKEASETLGFEDPSYKIYSSEKIDEKNAEILKKWFQKVHHMEVFGGEPFLLKEHKKLIALAIESGAASHMGLNYNSNGTYFSRDLIEAWKHFKYVDLGFSIDGVGERFTYQRYPAKWNEANQVIRSFYESGLKHLRLRFDLSINVLNVFYMKEFLEWSQNFPKVKIIYNFVHRPFHYSIKCLPEEAKKEALLSLDECLSLGSQYNQPIQNIKNFMMDQDLSPHWKDFLNESRRADAYRKQNLESQFPALTPWI